MQDLAGIPFSDFPKFVYINGKLWNCVYTL